MAGSAITGWLRWAAASAAFMVCLPSQAASVVCIRSDATVCNWDSCRFANDAGSPEVSRMKSLAPG